MDWIDIASIVFVAVTANHLGLVQAIEGVINMKLPIIDCPKCFSWWLTMLYMAITTSNVLTMLAVSFLASYIAIWLELFEGFTDTLYTRLYEKIYPDSDDNTDPAGSD